MLSKGESWLADHPEREFITQRYLSRRDSLVRQALARLVDEEAVDLVEDDNTNRAVGAEQSERELSLYDQRLGAVLAAIRTSGAKRVLDLGCGEGKLIRHLLADKQSSEIVGWTYPFVLRKLPIVPIGGVAEVPVDCVVPIVTVVGGHLRKQAKACQE